MIHVERVELRDSREISRQEVAQPLCPDLLLEVSSAQVDPLAVKSRFLRFRSLLVENLVDEADGDLLTVLSRSAVLDPVPKLRARDFGSGSICETIGLTML